MAIRRITLSLITLVAISGTNAANLSGSYDDWDTGSAADKSFIWAGTSNDSGERFEEDCVFSSKKCMWLLGLHTQCKPGTVTPVLVNTDTGAVSLNAVCLWQLSSGEYSYAFADFNALESAIKDTAKVGFACPLAAGEFIVVRFSLNGRTDSTQAMESYFSSRVSNATPAVPASRDPKDTTDQTL